ncbi:uncharacterized protein LOC127798274 [Diospyros lotus]|uniref:uncharacterized protein LOC127798274 n=1 Tax=Diospyros lotus TaxID=55363 RepID=UPI002253A557|nr:uncharacterized protein LOC127798274 [Diospyros lotus]
MATSNQGRLFSSIIKLAASKLGLSHAGSESLGRSSSDSARRLICYSTRHQQREDQANPDKVERGESKEIEEKIKEEIGRGENEDDGDELDINRDTGEVGGPRGPEPTRYGDWERNGRCYDF